MLFGQQRVQLRKQLPFFGSPGSGKAEVVLLHENLEVVDRGSGVFLDFTDRRLDLGRLEQPHVTFQFLHSFPRFDVKAIGPEAPPR